MISELQRKVVDALQPAAVTLDEDIVSWKPFEAAPVVFYVRFLSDMACKVNVNAKSPHDPGVISAFLRELTQAQLAATSEDQPVGISRSPVLAKTPFQLRAVVHPALSGAGLSKTTEFMKAVTYTTFPAYRCEFADDDSRDEAAFRLAKVIPWSQWSRQPAPALSTRFLRGKTAIKSTGGKRMGVIKLEELERIITYIGTDDGFVDIENYERVLAHVEHTSGRYEVHQGDDRWILRDEATATWLRVFATEGVAAANKSRADYVA